MLMSRNGRVDIARPENAVTDLLSLLLCLEIVLNEEQRDNLYEMLEKYLVGDFKDLLSCAKFVKPNVRARYDKGKFDWEEGS